MKLTFFINISVVLLLSNYSNGHSFRSANGYPNNGVSPAGPVSDYSKNYYEVIDQTNTAVLRIPIKLHVLKKHLYDDGARNMYVDGMYVSSYYDEEILVEDYWQLECGNVDVDVTVDYCDCQQFCDRSREHQQPSHVDLSYKLSFYRHDNNSMYFSAALYSIRADKVPGLTALTSHLMNHVNDRKHFGPFRMADFTKQSDQENNVAGTSNRAHRMPIKLFDDQVLKEWFLFEATEEVMFKETIWDSRMNTMYPVAETLRGEDAAADIVVAVSRDYTASLGRFDCIELLNDGRNFSSDSMFVQKGGCVRVYDGNKCTGSSRIVVQDQVYLFSAERGPKQSVLYGVKSMTGCCRDHTRDAPKSHFYQNHKGRIQRVPYGSAAGKPSDCKCSCAPAVDTGSSLDRFEPLPRDMDEFNATYAYMKLYGMLQAVKEMAVMSAIASTTDDSVSSATIAGLEAKNAAEVGAITLAKMQSYPTSYFRGCYEMGPLFVERMINDTMISAGQAAAKAIALSSAGTSSAFAWDAALAVVNLETFVANACQSWPDVTDY